MTYLERAKAFLAKDTSFNLKEHLKEDRETEGINPSTVSSEDKPLFYEINELTNKVGVCTCDPLPSVKDSGHLAHAGCGPDYLRCTACGKTWECKRCGGCRYCRVPG